ncbi:hypothetical protein [Allosalinactinospora lopnorensis]|nr:hypothetical protein [Allosalinactinospora lopnorensis]
MATTAPARGGFRAGAEPVEGEEASVAFGVGEGRGNTFFVTSGGTS